MDQYCFARWNRSSVVVVCRRLYRCRRAGRPAAGRVGGRVADTARRASSITSC